MFIPPNAVLLPRNRFRVPPGIFTTRLALAQGEARGGPGTEVGSERVSRASTGSRHHIGKPAPTPFPSPFPPEEPSGDALPTRRRAAGGKAAPRGLTHRGSIHRFDTMERSRIGEAGRRTGRWRTSLPSKDAPRTLACPPDRRAHRHDDSRPPPAGEPPGMDEGHPAPAGDRVRAGRDGRGPRGGADPLPRIPRRQPRERSGARRDRHHPPRYGRRDGGPRAAGRVHRDGDPGPSDRLPPPVHPRERTSRPAWSATS